MAPFVFLLFLLCEAASGSVVKVVQVGPEKLGQDVILECRTGDVTIRAVEWTRSDLVAPDYVLFYSDGRSDTTFQHSSFTGRVQLEDGDLKTGNVSLILKDVKNEDVGTYECRVQTAGSRRNKRAVIDSDPISRVKLQVTEDQKGHNNKEDTNKEDNNNNNNNNNNNGGVMDIFTRHHVGLVAAAAVVLLVSAAVGLFLVRKFKRQRENKPEPSVDEETGDNLI